MTDEEYMDIALTLAKKSLKYEDVPVGAIIVMNDKIVAKGYNQRVKNKKTCDHAEIIAIKNANKKLKNSRLDGATIYTTKEPCLMCMGAILSAKIKRVVYGASDLRFGTSELGENNHFNHKCEITAGVRRNECKKYLSDFFKKLR